MQSSRIGAGARAAACLGLAVLVSMVSGAGAAAEVAVEEVGG